MVETSRCSAITLHFSTSQSNQTFSILHSPYTNPFSLKGSVIRNAITRKLSSLYMFANFYTSRMCVCNNHILCVTVKVGNHFHSILQRHSEIRERNLKRLSVSNLPLSQCLILHRSSSAFSTSLCLTSTQCLSDKSALSHFFVMCFNHTSGSRFEEQGLYTVYTGYIQYTVPKYLDNDAFFKILPPYTNTMDLK